MVATLAFEKNCVLLCDVVSMSIYRYASCPPWVMAPSVLRGVRISKNFGILILVALLSITMVLSQLLSAVLLLDLDESYVRGPRYTDTYFRQVGRQLDPGLENALLQRPRSFPRFAEQTLGDSFHLSETPRGRALNDTGIILRAFPDVGTASDRSSMLYYHGRGGVMEAHVVCVSPDLDELTYHAPTQVTGKLSSEFLYRSTSEMESKGSFGWNRSQPSSNLTFDFNCIIGDQYGVIFCPLRPQHTGDCPGFPTKCLLSSTNTWFLVIWDFGSAWEYVDGNRVPVNETLTRQLYNKTGYEFDGTEWTTKTVNWNTTGGDSIVAGNYSVAMSLCVVAAGNSMATITANSAWRADEPSYGLQGEVNSSITKAISNQLSTAPTLERGVMNLTTYNIEEPQNFTEIIQTISGDRDNSSIWLEELDHIYSAIFVTYLLDTNTSLTLGLQALFTLVTSQAFYTELSYSEDQWREYLKYEENPSGYILQNITRTMQLTKLAQVPTHIKGLCIAFGIVALHIVSVATIFWLYCTCKAPKFLDQAWQTVGQLHRGQAKIFLDEAGEMGDLEVASLPGAARHWTKLVEITRDGGIAVKSDDTEPLLGMFSCITRSNLYIFDRSRLTVDAAQ